MLAVLAELLHLPARRLPVPLSLDGAAIAGLQAGQALNLQAQANAGGAVDFVVSLAGFSSAHRRLVELLG